MRLRTIVQKAILADNSIKDCYLQYTGPDVQIAILIKVKCLSFGECDVTTRPKNNCFCLKVSFSSTTEDYLTILQTTMISL